MHLPQEAELHSPVKPKRKTAVKDKVREDSEEDDQEDDYYIMPPQIMAQTSESVRETPIMANDVIEPKRICNRITSDRKPRPLT